MDNALDARGEPGADAEIPVGGEFRRADLVAAVGTDALDEDLPARGGNREAPVGDGRYLARCARGLSAFAERPSSRTRLRLSEV